jgi:hypothetical protein
MKNFKILHYQTSDGFIGSFIPFAHVLTLLLYSLYFVWQPSFQLTLTIFKFSLSSSLSHKFHHVPQEVQSCAKISERKIDGSWGIWVKW